MKILPALLGCLLLFAASAASAQTWGCPEKDYTCQLGRLMRALQDDPKEPENYFNIGLVFQRMGDHERAINSFSMYIAIPGLKPEYLADGYSNRGSSERARRRHEAAIADFGKAIELNPKNPRFFVNRGNVLSDLGRSDEAWADYTHAVQVDPRFALAYANRGHRYLHTGRAAEAIADLNKAIELDAANPEPYFTRAMAYRSNKQWDRSIADLDKYIQILPPGNDRFLADGYLNRGIGYASTGRLARAIPDMSKAIEFAPDYVDAYRARGVTYRQLGKNDLADADERKAAQLAAAKPGAAK